MATVERTKEEVAMRAKLMREARNRARDIKLTHQHFQPRREKAAPKTVTGFERRAS